MNNTNSIPSPCFVLDEHLLKKNLELIDGVQQRAGIKIILALKGFAMFSAAKLIRRHLVGTTASSLFEARLGSAEFLNGEVHAYSPAWLPADFEQLMDLCGHISFNSLSQYENLMPIYQKSTKKVSLGLRINPEYSTVQTDLYNPCVAGSRLGVLSEQLGATLPPYIEGLHAHNLCESDSFAAEQTLLNIERLFGRFLPHIRWLNLGGGHLMTRKGYDVEHLIATLKNFKLKYPNIEIIMEPGSAVAWQTGTLHTTVLDIVENKGIKTAIIDASISAHMPDCIEMPYKPAISGATDADGLTNELRDQKYLCRIGGLTCLAGDFLTEYAFDEPLQVGDKLIFEDMMHYTMVKTTTFNGVNLPSIGILKENGVFQLVKTFYYEDFRNRLS